MTVKAAADILVRTRQSLYDLVKDLTQSQWFEQPEGFANNIAWNVGHLVLAQQGLTYTRLGLKPDITRQYAKMYSPGTSPADWEMKPDTDDLLDKLVSLSQKLADDVAAGVFDGLELPTESPIPQMPVPESIEHAMIFNQYHEGMHLGVIVSLMDNIKEA